ncbi:cobalamin-binding protein [Paenibacillus aurantius]|uniref:Cobalamin-binding protein n=1 Tax=Paenibacillus aurantius TaxID=2918900 RepID=A0AA96LF38_9BACL|nr:cobalamin-binding protein [Paenibacillus aurantius]WNQ10940.1 cobalamin-binding protein [Paenibacillus aurantius]
MRIVSLCPSNTEALAFLGLEKLLVGTDNYSDWPEGVRELPKLGPDLDIDMDRVEALKPDLVVASLTVPGMEKNVERLVERGLPHLVLSPNKLDDVADNLLTLGEATGRQEAAGRAHEAFTETIRRYREISRRAESRPSVYWEWWAKPVFTPGGGNWLTELTELAGGRNLFADRPEPSVRSTWEEVAERQPDHIALAWVGIRPKLVKPDTVRARPGWDALEAVRRDRIHVMEEALFCRPSPRLLDGLKKLATVLHPELYGPMKGGEPI